VHPGTPALTGGSAASLVQGLLQGTRADTGRFLETDMAEAKKTVPAVCVPAQFFLTTSWFILSGFLLLSL